MKKLTTLALALMLALSLAACSSKSDSVSSNSSETESDNSNNSPADSDSSNNSPSDSGNNNNASSTPLVSALTDSTIFVDLVEVETDTTPHNVDNIIMVPVQAVMETIGYDVNWDPKEQKLEVWEPSKQHPTIILTIGNITAYYEKYAEEIDECVSYEATLASPPILIDDTVFAPLIFVAEAVGYTIDSNVDSEDIYLFSPYYMENQIGEGIGETQPITEGNQSGEGIGESQPVKEDNQSGEGIGESRSVTEEEKNYVLSIRTESWLDLKQEKKEEIISIMARWWDTVDGYVVADFDAVLADLDHQMETYYRNGVDEGILQTACDIYGLDISKYIP